MKPKARVIVGSPSVHVGPGEEWTVVARTFDVETKWVNAEVRINKHDANVMRFFGQRITDPADIDLIIETLKTAKKLLKLKMTSEAAIAKLVARGSDEL